MKSPAMAGLFHACGPKSIPITDPQKKPAHRMAVGRPDPSGAAYFFSSPSGLIVYSTDFWLEYQTASALMSASLRPAA